VYKLITQLEQPLILPIFTDADNNWTAAEFNNTNKDNGALDAHWGAEKTYDYFNETWT
jgi:hypothetical protein